MTYRQKYAPDDIKDGKCPECGSNRLLFRANTVNCNNCGIKIGERFNKYGAKKTEFNGHKYDSKFEAGIAAELELQKKAREIKDYDRQFKVEMWVYREDGVKAFKVTHKVDFRAHENDGSYTLIEAKGMILPDYKWRRKLLEHLWLPHHPDHKYEVIQQRSSYGRS